jgi:hypothetical protein
MQQYLTKTIPLCNEEQDQQTTKLNMDANFATEIPDALSYRKITGEEGIILWICYTDSFKKDEQLGAGVFQRDNVTPPKEESYYLSKKDEQVGAGVF